MGLSIGIDLGTSNSAVAIYRRGKIETIPVDGRKIFPSVVSFKENNQVLVGYGAKSRLYIDPENSIASSKRFIGTDKKYHVRGQTLTPVDIARELLKKIKDEATRFVGEEITDAVITIPAYFTEEQREATKRAGELAGFNVLRLLPEPTAAAIAYGLEKERNQTIMVYDLGGGTFDVSILKVENNNFRVLAVDGDSQLGGDDFDDMIVNYVLDKSNIALGSSNAGQDLIVKQRLKEAAEELKKELSESEIADISIPDIFGTHIDEEITTTQFNELVKPLLDKTLRKMEDVLLAAKLTKRDISRVILVGGSTRMKCVQTIVKEQVKQPFIADNVDEIVAHGAAILAANLSAPDVDNAPIPIEVVDVTAHSFGIALIDTSDNDKLKVYHLIKKNTPLPCRGSKLASTMYPFQKEVLMRVHRTESIVPIDETNIGELLLPVSKQKYHVTAVALFDIDEDGILTFSSAELKKDSQLLKRYAEIDQVDMKLLSEMLERKEIHTKQVIIDTKRGVKQ